MQLSQKFLVLASTLLFAGYLSTCKSNDEVESLEEFLPKIWPNLSANGSFLQFPGLSGSGGLDFSTYDLVAGIVNKTRLFPSKIAQIGNYTLLQFAIMATVGGLLTGAAALLAEAHFFRLIYGDLIHDGFYGSPGLGVGGGAYGAPAYGVPVNPAYGPPPAPQYGPPPAPQYGPPPTPQYGPPPAPQYGPPPAPQYGPPPAPQYGPPPTPQYGPPPAPQYGPPPAPQYGPPPAPQYGTPPAPQYGTPPAPPSQYNSISDQSNQSPPSTYNTVDLTYGSPDPSPQITNDGSSSSYTSIDSSYAAPSPSSASSVYGTPTKRKWKSSKS